MGAVLRPVGPLPPAVYWRRRAVVVVLLALVLLLAGRALGAAGATSGGGSGGSSGAPTSHPTTSATQHPTASATQHPAATTPAAPTRATPASTTPGLCPDAAVTVTAGTDATSYAAGVIPGLTLTIINHGTVACRRDLGPGALGLTVRSGPDRIWSSDDCQARSAPQLRVLAPGKGVTETVPWTRHRSSPSCPTTAPAAALPGTYVVTAHAGTATSAPAVFRLG